MPRAHGHRSTYSAGCRCDACATVESAHRAQRRVDVLPAHSPGSHLCPWCGLTMTAGDQSRHERFHVARRTEPADA